MSRLLGPDGKLISGPSVMWPGVRTIMTNLLKKQAERESVWAGIQRVNDLRDSCGVERPSGKIGSTLQIRLPNRYTIKGATDDQEDQL